MTSPHSSPDTRSLPGSTSSPAHPQYFSGSDVGLTWALMCKSIFLKEKLIPQLRGPSPVPCAAFLNLPFFLARH